MIPWEDGIQEFSEKILASKPSSSKKGTDGFYYEIPCSYDSEWTSWMEGDEKRATLYIWMLGVGTPDDAVVIYGRTTEEFKECIDLLVHLTGLDDYRKIAVYVHYLGADFQFIRRWFDWDKVFTDDARGIYYAKYHGVEFRCELKLSGGRSLSECGKGLRHYTVRKKVGDLDYSLKRNSATPLTLLELGYCEHDVLVSLAYIAEKIIDDGGLSNIPMTNTGYVRRFMRDKCTAQGNKNYRETMSRLTLDEPLYITAKEVFRGGDTHANPFYVGQTLENVCSFDLTSAYPGAMVLRKFPMSTPEIDEHICSEADLDYICSKSTMYFIAHVSFYGLMPKIDYIHSLSHSKTQPKRMENQTLDNGRIVEAEYTSTYLNELDYMIMKSCYDWDRLEIDFCYVGRKGYLPTQFVKGVLELYKNKTELKKVKGKEREYMISKNMINATFGMSVTDPIKPEIVLDNDDEEEPYKENARNLAEELRKLNNSRSRFLYYLWGVWTTAWCRHELYNAIHEFENDFVYCDTDSVKGLRLDLHKDFVESRNKEIMKMIEDSARFHRIPIEMYCPKTPSNKECPIGLWDFEGVYDKFKTLGSKRYLVEKNGKYQMTISGVRKSAVSWLMKDDKSVPYDARELASHIDSDMFVEPFDGYQRNPFEGFDWGMSFPAGVSGRTIHTYIDKETEGTLVDYLGNVAVYHELSSLYVENSEYTMDRVEDFIRFVKMIQRKEWV